MSFKCAHISDIHWRGLKRHDEYKKVFHDLFEKLCKENLDAIFIGGDIVHSKTQGISPELIDNLNWWFTSLASIAPTHIILGNHDGLILNKDRQDAITPIVNSLNNNNIFLYKKSGTYKTLHSVGSQRVNWCVFSCFDEENWNHVKPIAGDINIACFHGAVWGSKTDVDWELEGEVSVSFFDGFDFTFLGDIHKLQYLDTEKRIAYPGSTIQQNFGEDIQKGCLIWDIKNKNEFTSKFLKVENPSPYVTVDWKGSVADTILYLEKIKKNAKFRIRSTQSINQAEIKLLYHFLKEDKQAKEIVFQNLNSNSIDNKNIVLPSNSNINIRDHSNRRNILLDFFSDSVMPDRVENVNSLFKKYLDLVPNTLSAESKKWSINKLEFENTFAYGKDNVINFNKLDGVVGLFGNNRAGKSSIPGTLMYCLFNTSDRGSIKNQNIVNTRKGACLAKTLLSVDNKEYEVIRTTTKKSNKNGSISATTSLTLKCFEDGLEINISEEQRRETEKTLREIIGTSEDFLYTSFASQGEMNAFVKEKSSARKSVLSKFLRLDLFEELYKKSREDYIVLKNKQNNLSRKNWKELKENSLLEIEENKNKKLNLKDNISLLREKEISLNVSLRNLKNNITQHPSGFTLETVTQEVNSAQENLCRNKRLASDLEEKIQQSDFSLEKIKNFKNSFSLEEIKQSEQRLQTLKRKLISVKNNKVFINTEISRNKNSLKILEDVPCNEKYSNCKFIKEAYQSKNQIEDLNKEFRDLEKSIYEIQNSVKNLESQAIEEKIKKFNEVNNKEYKIKVDLERCIEKKDALEKSTTSIKEKLENYKKVQKELLETNNIDISNELEKLKQQINSVQSSIYDKESIISNITKDVFVLEEEIKSFDEEEKVYYDLIDAWKTHDLFSFAVSKKGIPTMLISNSLPLLNIEINKILTGVTNFNIFLEDEDNNLNVYIDYGDSKRIIECASGMEKMIASIAIRVALINISSLPKSNIFIIDEGFGALDSSNVESCSRLLKSLKKYFKTILIISHVDTIKDIVDKNIIINKRKKDAYVEYK